MLLGAIVCLCGGHEVGVALNTGTMKQETQLATSIYSHAGFQLPAPYEEGCRKSVYVLNEHS